MRKLVLAVVTASLFLSVATLSAQSTDGSEPHAAVQVSFLPPLSTNGFQSMKYTNDFSLNILAGLSKNERAFALAGMANVVVGDARGVQVAGLGNYAGGDGSGFQLGGLGNIVCGDYAGFQMGGMFNVAGDVNGMQLAGLFNVAKNVRGVQFAPLLNIAHHSDYPIGLVNIIKDGEMGISAGYNELGTMSLTFRSGGRVLYGIIGLGYNHNADRFRDSQVAIAGFGAHINVNEYFRINNELTTESIDCFSEESAGGTFKTGYALLPAFRLGHLELFGGPSINYMQSKDQRLFNLFPSRSLWDKTSDAKMQQLYVGWQVGVQFVF